MGLRTDPSLDRIGRRLSEVVKRKDLPWRFWVIEDWHTYNAFAAPGGFVFITRIYYEKLNDDEAAFVLGHEMAHVDLSHYERQLRRARRADLGHLLLNVIVGGSDWTIATDIGATAYMTHYSRGLEREADLTGYRYAQAAGFNADLAVTALSKLGEKPDMPPWLANVWGTHPLLSSREDRLAAMGGKEPKEITAPEPSPAHKRDLTDGLEPFDPKIPIAVRILATDGKRWENPWRKDFTQRLHLRLTPHGFSIAGDDLMYKSDIGDPVEAARSRNAKYLLLIIVTEMSSVDVGKERAPAQDHTSTPKEPSTIAGTPVNANVKLLGRLLLVADGSVVWEQSFSQQRNCADILPIDNEILYTDTCLGSMVDDIAGQIGQACAKAAGAEPAKTKEPNQ